MPLNFWLSLNDVRFVFAPSIVRSMFSHAFSTTYFETLPSPSISLCVFFSSFLGLSFHIFGTLHHVGDFDLNVFESSFHLLMFHVLPVFSRPHPLIGGNGGGEQFVVVVVVV